MSKPHIIHSKLEDLGGFSVHRVLPGPSSGHAPHEQRITHGLQIWVGLPKEHEQCEPSFIHWEQDHLPNVKPVPTLDVKVMLGNYLGVSSPVKTFGPTLLMDFVATRDTEFILPLSETEMGFFLVSGSASINGKTIQPNEMGIIHRSSDPIKNQPGDQAHSFCLTMTAHSRLIVLGGEPFPERRYMWWNFVSSDKKLIEQASEKWLKQEFDKIPGETEFTPLPTDPDA